eukprot:2446475-Amphidinium_carterae.2
MTNSTSSSMSCRLRKGNQMQETLPLYSGQSEQYGTMPMMEDAQIGRNYGKSNTPWTEKSLAHLWKGVPTGWKCQFDKGSS